MKIKPSLTTGVVALVPGFALLIFPQLFTDISYSESTSSVKNLIEGSLPGVALASVYFVIVTTVFGWWKPVLRESTRAGSRWMFLAPTLMVIGPIGALAQARWSGMPDAASYLFWAAVVALLIGFWEELAFRGIMLVGARRSIGELGVALSTSALFGLLHGINILFGQAAGETIIQVVFAALVGIVYYVARRVTGSLIVPILLHALWDFSSFVPEYSLQGETVSQLPFGILCLLGALLVSIAALVTLVRRGPATDTVTGPAAAAQNPV